MRAVVYRGVNDLRLETVPVPRIGPGELLVRVAACGVCPTDIKKIQYGTVPPPRIFGHETAGVISKLGSGASGLGWKIGDRVALHHHVPCLDCHICRHHAFAQCETYKRTGITAGFEPAGGGYAEYVRVLPFVLPGVVKIPAGIPLPRAPCSNPSTPSSKPSADCPCCVATSCSWPGRGLSASCSPACSTRRHAGHRHRFDGRQTQTGQKIAANWAMLAPNGTGRAELPLRHSNPGRAEHRRPALPLSAPKRGEGGRRPGEVFSTFIHRTTCGRGLDAAVIAVPSDAVVRQAQTWLRGGGQLMLFAHTKRGAVMEIDPATVCVDEKDLLGSYSSDFTLQDEVARLVSPAGSTCARSLPIASRWHKPPPPSALPPNPPKTPSKSLWKERRVTVPDLQNHSPPEGRVTRAPIFRDVL